MSTQLGPREGVHTKERSPESQVWSWRVSGAHPRGGRGEGSVRLASPRHHWLPSASPACKHRLVTLSDLPLQNSHSLFSGEDPWPPASRQALCPRPGCSPLHCGLIVQLALVQAVLPALGQRLPDVFQKALSFVQGRPHVLLQGRHRPGARLAPASPSPPSQPPETQVWARAKLRLGVTRGRRDEASGNRSQASVCLIPQRPHVQE